MSLHVRSRLLLLAAALLFSTGGAAIKAATLTPWQVAGFRSVVAAVAMLILLPAARRNWGGRVWLAGVTYAATLVTFVVATKLTTAANAIFLQSTAPLYVLLLGPWLLKEPIRRKDMMTIALVGTGLALFFAGTEAPRSTAPDPVRGDVIATASGLFWALTIMALRWLRGGGAEPTVVAGNTLAFLFCVPWALPVQDASAADWGVIAYLGLFQIGLAYVCLSTALRHVPALEATLLLLVEPALNPVWAWLVHGERPGPYAVAGGGLILAATLLQARGK
jgi:drug/metabolite transporter, DME family